MGSVYYDQYHDTIILLSVAPRKGLEFLWLDMGFIYLGEL